MCGICGTLNHTKDHAISADQLKRMILAIRHRGPDEFGIYKDSHIGLGHARLSIIDLEGGQQPIHNEDRSVWVVYNGEIFNYVELKEELIKKGHRFYTKTDTEVLVHLYEDKGPDFLNELNGQFAFALWDLKRKKLMLARDRVGIRPLFYTVVDGSLLFASEVKSIFEDRRVSRRIDLYGLDELFTFWSTMPPRTVFEDICEVPPAHYLIAHNGEITIKRYWDLDFCPAEVAGVTHSEESYAEHFLDLLKDSIRLRLRADVDVAAYLSGGIDSSLIAALVKKHFNNRLQTFSINFSDKEFDEGNYQKQMAEFLQTEHSAITCSYADIGRIMPEVIQHTEKPLIRTAPAPLFLLSKLVRKNKIKVVLTGEGADEILGGYDLFREMKIRRFWAKYPHSRLRPLLMRKLYSYVPHWQKTASAFLEGFYRSHLLKTDSKFYSHLPRWDVTSRIKGVFSREVKEKLKERNREDIMQGWLPEAFDSWDSLGKSQYLEIITLLSGNLLSSQGDRMMMSHSVEGRYPFLDYRVMEFCAKLPASMKLKVMQEKYLLKKIAKPYLPEAICLRTKQAYRAPDSASFFNGRKPKYLSKLLSRENLVKTGYFDPEVVGHLVKKCSSSNPSLLSARDNMAVVAVITTLLLDRIFIRDFSNGYQDRKMSNMVIAEQNGLAI